MKRINNLENFELGKNLKFFRKLNNMTQLDVVEKLNDRGINISIPTYNRYENNNRQPVPKLLIEFAKIFNTDVNTLLDFDKIKENNITKNEFIKNEINLITKQISELKVKIDYLNELMD